MNRHQRHITFLCSRLDLPGGIERAIVNTAALLCNNGMAVSLLILDETAHSFYPLYSGIKIHQVSLFFGLDGKGNFISKKRQLLSDARLLKKTLHNLQPDIVIATEYPFAVAAVLSGVHWFAKLLSWEHHHYAELKRSRLWEMLFRFSYPKLHAVVCLNADEQKQYSRHNQKVVVIPNYVVPTNTKNPSPRNKRLLTVARLAPVKGIDRLLQVASRVLPQNPDWHWKLIGSGEQQAMVRQFVEQHRLAGQLIVQAPASPFLSEEYQSAALYVMTSRNECFPMTLLEAAQEGLPLVAFDCETGPRHIIQQGLNGYLFDEEDITGMSAALQSLIHDEEKRKTMTDAARRVTEKFSGERVLLLWKALFNSLE